MTKDDLIQMADLVGYDVDDDDDVQAPAEGRYFDEIEVKAKAPKKPALPWYSTEQLTMDKARELGMTPRPGEDMGQFRSRIAQKVSETA